MAQRTQYDETKFKPGQREAAIALVEYEFTPNAQRKTKQQIADEVGVGRMTLYNWDTKDANFIAYKQHLAAQFVDSKLPLVYNKMVESIEKGSVRAMELFLKRAGDLDIKQDITINNGDDNKNQDERKADIMRRLGLDDDTNTDGNNDSN